MRNTLRSKCVWMVSTALCLLGVQTSAYAQESQTRAASVGVEDIVVTAQRREQNLQVVPVAVTAISQEALQVNRIQSIADIGSIAPGVIATSTSGGSAVPAFTIRGVNSTTSTTGADKQVSVYVDGVYLGSARGSVFELPDIERLEVLRGPQGTLFGRNATAGALSIVTRDPTGEFGFTQQLSAGNFDLFRTRTTIDLPQFGDFSAYASYVEESRDGDIRNLGVGTSFDRTGPFTNLGRSSSPSTLGASDNQSFFAAIQFEPNDRFSATYKFDWADQTGSTNGQGMIAYDPTYRGIVGPLIDALVTSNNAVLVPNGRRPDALNNWYNDDIVNRNTGHNITVEFEATDNLSFTNILAYRESSVSSGAQIDGLGGLYLTPEALGPYALFVAASTTPNFQSLTPMQQGAIVSATATALTPAIGQPFSILSSVAASEARQLSNEFQVNYDSDVVTATAGLLYFESTERAGGPVGMANIIQFAPIPNFAVPLGNSNITHLEARSLAAYARGEFHVTDQLDLIAGGRYTRDEKEGDFQFGETFTPDAPGSRTGTYSGGSTTAYTYEASKFTYELGLNYQVSEDIFTYVKYATGYVSGGSIANIAFEEEEVQSIELGLKADFFSGRLRTNLAIYRAQYDGLQQPVSGSNIGRNELAAAIFNIGDSTVNGVELEVTAVPIESVTLGASVGYTNQELSNVDPARIADNGGRYEYSRVPEWTLNLFSQYESGPLFANSEINFFARVDAGFRSELLLVPNPDIPVYADPVGYSPDSWKVNLRTALQNIPLGGGTLEIAAWGRNIFDEDVTTFVLPLQFGATANFEPARTYGIDITWRY